MPPVWKRHNEIKNRSALHLSAMSIQKRSIPTTGALGCSPATPAPQRLYVESDCPTATAPVQQSQGCHSSRWHAIRPGHRSHGAHSLHTPRIHLAREIHEVTRDPKSFFPCDVGLSPNILGSDIPKSGVSPDLALTRQVVDFHGFPQPAASILSISSGSVTRCAWVRTQPGSCCGSWPLWSSTVQSPTSATRESPMLHSTACWPSGHNSAAAAVVPKRLDVPENRL